MIRNYLLALTALIALSSAATAGDGVQCRLAVLQFDTGAQTEVLLFEDTAVFAKGVPANGFIGPFSLEIDFNRIDSSGVMFNLHIVTLGFRVNTYSRAFSMDWGLPARIDGIEGKNGTQYALIISPLAEADLDAGCTFNHRDSGAYLSSPSAFMDLYYVPSSLAEFHWQSARDYLDFEYRRFQTFAGNTLPGKLMVYLSPCPVYSVIWDGRFGMAVDPTRNSTYAIYAKEANTADPFIVTYPSLLRNHGYAPAFLAEGLANYFSFAVPEMRRILADDPGFSIEPLLNTYQYFSADPHVADRAAATFVHYLVDTYQLDRLMQVYKAADDLNLKSKLEEVYELSTAEIEAGWKNWLDTVTVETREYDAAARLAEQMLNYPQMLKYARWALESSENQRDSVKALDILKRAYFFTGDYYRATATQAEINSYDTAKAVGWMAKGAYEMMAGQYVEAREDIDMALSLDSTNQMVLFNLALNYIYRGDEASAKEILMNNISGGNRGSAQGETMVVLGGILEKSSDSAEADLALSYYNTAAAGFQQAIQLRPGSASPYMWLGIALLGMNETQGAIDQLRMARFLETRPFYVGMINLWLGKAYERAGQTEEARRFFTEVLATASADYHQRDARQCLEKL